MKRDNKHKIPGFAWKGKFTTRSEVDRYFLNDEGIQCLLCGRFLGTLQNHLQLVHGVSNEEYLERYGLPWRKGWVSRSATFWGKKATSASLPLFGSRIIAFRSSISPGLSLRTSPTLMPLLAMSSSNRRFLGFRVLKIISSTTSFSRILSCVGLPARNSFRSAGLSQGFWISRIEGIFHEIEKGRQEGEP